MIIDLLNKEYMAGIIGRFCDGIEYLFEETPLRVPVELHILGLKYGISKSDARTAGVRYCLTDGSEKTIERPNETVCCEAFKGILLSLQSNYEKQFMAKLKDWVQSLPFNRLHDYAVPVPCKEGFNLADASGVYEIKIKLRWDDVAFAEYYGPDGLYLERSRVEFKEKDLLLFHNAIYGHFWSRIQANIEARRKESLKMRFKPGDAFVSTNKGIGVALSEVAAIYESDSLISVIPPDAIKFEIVPESLRALINAARYMAMIINNLSRGAK